DGLLTDRGAGLSCRRAVPLFSPGGRATARQLSAAPERGCCLTRVRETPARYPQGERRPRARHCTGLPVPFAARNFGEAKSISRTVMWAGLTRVEDRGDSKKRITFRMFTWILLSDVMSKTAVALRCSCLEIRAARIRSGRARF